MKLLLWFVLSAAMMVQAWQHGMLNVKEKLKSKVPQEATKPVSKFFMREDGTQAYRMMRIGSRVKDGASSIASSGWQTDTTKTTNSGDRVKRSTSTMVSNVCQEDAATTTNSEDRANGSASTIAPSVSQGDGTKHAVSVNLVEVTTKLVSRPEQEATSNVIDIGVTKPVTCELLINYYEARRPEPQPEPTCIDNWDYVSTSLLSLIRKVFYHMPLYLKLNPLPHYSFHSRIPLNTFLRPSSQSLCGIGFVWVCLGGNDNLPRVRTSYNQRFQIQQLLALQHCQEITSLNLDK